MSVLGTRRAAWSTSRLPTQRKQLEAALEAALSVVEAALALIDAMDGDADLEPCWEDEGAACDDEGAESDRAPDLDGDGRPEPSWQVSGRDMHLLDGADCGWGERDCPDPDEAPCLLQPPRYGYRVRPVSRST